MPASAGNRKVGGTLAQEGPKGLPRYLGIAWLLMILSLIIVPMTFFIATHTTGSVRTGWLVCSIGMALAGLLSLWAGLVRSGVLVLFALLSTLVSIIGLAMAIQGIDA